MVPLSSWLHLRRTPDRPQGCGLRRDDRPDRPGVVLLAIWASVPSLPLMVLLTGLLGALTYAAVPALQARVIGLSHIHAPQAPAVAAGLNIAGFNGGIALGSLLGGASLEMMSLTSTAWVGAVAVGLGIAWMLWQMRGPAFLGARLHG